MENSELTSYMEGKSISMIYTTTFIDYEQIERPVRSIVKGSKALELSNTSKTSLYYLLKTNEFRDTTRRIQLFGEEESTQFLTLDSVQKDKSDVTEEHETLFEAWIMLTEQR